jgi:hypothetical protein
VGQDYGARVETAADGRCLTGGGIAVSLAAGALPRGLMLRGDLLSGPPAAVGTYRFSLRATNACGAVQQEFELKVTGKPILRAAPEQLEFECKAGGPAPAEQVVQVSGTWPGQPYAVSARTAPWLTLRPVRGTTPEPDSALSADLVAVSVDPDKLAAGTYRGTLSVAAWEGANTVSIPVVLRVAQ